MKKNLFTCLLIIANLLNIQAKNNNENVQDTVQSTYLDEILILNSTKETNSLKTLPGSVSLITSQMVENQKIIHIKDLSVLIPNFFIPDYGSKLSVPVYIRGIGERSTGQSIGMYVDDIPFLDKSFFDFEFMDISGIEVLRGPQGTLYGRNAMSGIVNIRTHSPLDARYGKVSLSTGNYGLFRAKASVSELLAKNAGISVSGYYDGNDGYFTNQYSGKKADRLKSAGARFRLDWKLNPEWTAGLNGYYDFSDQGAFPYGIYNDGQIASPDYNYPGNYNRKTAGGSFNLNFTGERFIFNSNTGFQYLNDDMKMDTDNSTKDLFTLNQRQREKAWIQEFTIRSNTRTNYRWSFGVFGFYNDMATSVVTTMGKDGIAENIENYISNYLPQLPPPTNMAVSVLNEKIPMPGKFKTPSYGGAVFHQSTYNNLFTKGLSVTAGIRLDYEKAELDYDTQAEMSMNFKTPSPVAPPVFIPVGTILTGKRNTSFKEVLPKASVKYELNEKNYIYATISNGYKTGGYNIQNFADIARNALMKETVSGLFERMPPFISKPEINLPSMSIDSVIPYKPEYSWNYELGFKGELIEDRLQTEVAVYYIDVKDIQITDFVNSGQGRILKNAGKAKSVGFDLTLSSRITNELGVSINYGFTKATFNDYKTSKKQDDGNLVPVDYSGNYIPFAPQNTLSFSAVYNKLFRNKWIDRFHIQAQYNAVGKIYWTEANDVSQNFYGLLNLRTGINKGIFGLNFWVNNVLNEKYTAFYFESMQQKLAQRGKPFTFGIEANISF
jgi:outer membrane receptor protein involved in Fe transport